MRKDIMKTIMLIALLTGLASPSLADHAALYERNGTGGTDIQVMLLMEKLMEKQASLHDA